MDNRKKYDSIKEIFPDLSDDKIEKLINTNKPLDEIVEQILNNDTLTCTLTLDECLYNLNRKKPYTNYLAVPRKPLNYPELFDRNSNIDIKTNPADIRSIAVKKSKKAEEYRQLAAEASSIASRRDLCSYYIILADNLRDEIEKLNYQASLMILKRMIKRMPPNSVDLHGLHVSEAIKFLEDYIEFYKPVTLTIVTGREENSPRIRPAVIKYVKELNNYKIRDIGASILLNKIVK
ncbi:NEDD4-binding protein 2 [Astathelohania contejeani]|uniref:NEDD4-binding protein 2 n=1 Tax=Astathelohania contejeani TaxID=164912 RepID=A0ABQ7I294_9MICR|nr:NEDD4-binding protein 2 [Thelohania contejeani]